MKGLLVKDFKLLKTQRIFLIIIMAISILFLVQGRQVSYIFAYVSAMIAVVVTATITYDQMDNGMNFIITFPVSRKKYVLAKYVFGMLMTVCLIGILSVGMLVMNIARPLFYGLQEYLSGVFGILMTSVFIMSVMIPVHLRFGAEKSRYASLIMIGGAALATYVVQEAAKAMHVDLEAELEWILRASPAEVAVCLIVLAVVLLGISYMISAAVMKRKQF